MGTSLLAIQKSNIQLITAAIWQETEPDIRMGLNKLLVQEQDKYVILPDHLEMAHQNIVFSRTQLIHQQQLVAQLMEAGNDTTAAEQTWTIIQDAHDLHLLFYARVAREIVKLRDPPAYPLEQAL